MADVAKGSVLLTPRFDNLTSSISKQLSGAFKSSSGIGSSAGGTLGTSFNSGFATKIGAISGLVSSITSKALSVVSSSMDSAISRVDTLNNFPKVMQTMGFSAEDASAAINKMSEGIEGLPTALDEITGNAQKIALLTGDLDSATDTALALNNAFLYSGSSSSDAARGLTQYTQMLAKGKPDAQSWNSILETMGPALTKVADKLGYTSTRVEGDLYNALMDGTLSFNDFNAAIVECNNEVGGFAEGAATASAGIRTSMQNASTAVIKNVANIIDAINGAGLISGFFENVKATVNSIGGILTPIAKQIGEAIPSAITKVTNQFTAFKKRLAEIENVSHVFQRLKAQINYLVDTFKFAIDTAIAPFKEAVQDAFEGISADSLALMVSTIATNFEQLIQRAGGIVAIGQTIKSTIVDGMAAAVEYMQPILASVEAIIPSLEQLASAILPTIFQMAQSILPAIAQIAQAVLPVIINNVGVLAGVITNLLGLATQIVQTFVPVITSIVQTVAPAISTISTVTGALYNTVIAFIASLMPQIEALVNRLLPLVAPVVQTIVAVVTTLVGIGQQLLAFLQPLISDIVVLATNLVSILTPAITSICTFIQTIMPAIQLAITAALTVISTVWNAVFPVLQNVATTVFESISGIVSAVMNVISSVISVALNLISGNWSGAWNSCKNLIGTIWNGIVNGVRSGINIVTTLIGALPQTIVNLFAGAGSLLTGIGRSIIEGLWSGMKAIWSSVSGWLSGLGAKIKSLKGPIQKDRKLLIPEGGAITNSLLVGLKKNIDDVYEFVGGIGSDISDSLSNDVSVQLSARANAYTASRTRANSLADGAGESGVTNFYLDGSLLQTDAQIQSAINTLLSAAKRRTAMA